MTIAASEIILRAGHHLQDTDHIRWTVEELVSWINEAAKAVVTRRLDAGAVIDNLPLVAGTKQTLAADIYRLIDITRNMGDGATPGRAVVRVDRNLLDSIRPDWHTDAQNAVTRNFMYDGERNPTVFFVYPPAVNGKSLEAVVAKFPDDIADEAGEVDLEASFEESILNYVLYRCYAKDSEFGDPAKAVAQYNAFLASLGEQVK